MIAISKATELDLVGQVLDSMRLAIERRAKRRGHLDPSDFFGDIAHEVLKRTSKRPGQTVSQSYVFWLVENRLRDYHRRRPPFRQRLDVDQEDKKGCAPQPTGPDDLRRAEFAKKILAKFRPKAREIFVRRAVGDESYAKIAEAIGMSEGGVRSSYDRSRKRLRDAFANGFCEQSTS